MDEASSAQTSPPAFIGSDLGVIVDGSIIDDDDDLSIQMDLPSVINEEGSFVGSLDDSEPGARVMKNGKVRRKLRWSGFRRKKKNNPSSNQSVVSALTARSSATNRSGATSRSFLSHFSRKSQNSFHTFHSTATPVVKNSRQSQHTFERPNYNDTFDFGINGPSTIDGHQPRSRSSQSKGSRGKFQPAMSQISEMEFDHPHGEVDIQGISSVDPPEISINVGSARSSSPKQTRSRRPPLFQRISNLGKSKEQRISASIETIPTSSSSLSQPFSMERQESQLPVLEPDDYEGDRRVALMDRDEETETSRQQNKELERTGGNAINSNSQSAEAASVATTSVSSSSTSSVSQGRNTPSRPYNRQDGVVNANTRQEGETTKSMNSDPRPNRASIPVDVDDAAFLEAEHNLRAIHKMATEHLVHGEYEEAIDVFEEILRGQEARFGINSYRVGTALHNLGLVYMKSGNYKKSIAISRRAVSVRKEALIPNHPDVAISLAQLGVALLESKQFLEALTNFKEALSIRRNHVGPKHLKNAKILNNIGCAEYAMQHYEEALEAFNEALEIQQRSLKLADESGDSTLASSDSTLLSVASTLCNIGSIMSRQERYEKAEHAFEEALLVSVFPLSLAVVSSS